MRHFFIDLENVRSYGLEGVLLLKPEDMIYVFYSDNANTLTIPTIESLNESPATVKYIKTNYTGANAMDFQIVTLLGATIERDKSGTFYIISHDNGFKSAVKFCEGYFTSYDITTGVYANILLAINSEKNAKKLDNSKVEMNSDKNSGEQKQEKKGNRRGRHHKKHEINDDGNNKADNKNDSSVVALSAENSDKEGTTSSDFSSEEIKSNSVSNAKNRRNRSRRFSKNNRKDDKSLQNDVDKQDSDVTISLDVENSDSAKNNSEKNDDNVASISAQSKKTNSRKNRHRANKKTHETDKKSSSTIDEKMVVKSNDADISEKDANTVENKNTKKNVKQVQKSSDTSYLYNILSDYLSKSTIDMYASVIDEGVRESKDKEALHKYFKKRYDSDEAEALFKIIGSDFSKLKKQRTDK